MEGDTGSTPKARVAKSSLTGGAGRGGCQVSILHKGWPAWLPGAVKLLDNRYAIPTKEPGLSKTLGKILWNFVPSLKVFFGAAKFMQE